MISIVPAYVGVSTDEADDERKILRDVSFASYFGSLADRLVLAALRVQSRIDERLDPAAANAAIQILQSLISATAQPVHVSGHVRDIGALSFLTARSSQPGASVEPGDHGDDVTEMTSQLNTLSDAIQAGRDASATQDQLDLILRTFTHVAEATLSAASESLSHNHSESSWKIATPHS